MIKKVLCCLFSFSVFSISSILDIESVPKSLQLFPFAAMPPSDADIIDWDIQNFSENQLKFQTGATSYGLTTSTYVALLYKTEGSFFVGVTYEMEHSFRWLKVLSNANIQGSAAIKTTASTIILNTSTSAVSDASNDSTVNVLYDVDTNYVCFVAFNYLTGVVQNNYKISKSGINGLSTNIVAANVHMSPSFLSTADTMSSTFNALHFVMSIGAEALEIQIDLSAVQNAIPKRIFKYSKHSPTFQNGDFSKVLGISSPSEQMFRNGLSNLLSLDQTLWGSYQPGVDILNSSPDSRTKYMLTYYKSLFDQTGTSAVLWFYSGTAFLKRVSNTNTVYWYISRYYNDKQEISEFKYQFESTQALTSYVVSPDAPGLCMTSFDSGQTTLYLDDIHRAVVFNEHAMWSNYTLNDSCYCSTGVGAGSSCSPCTDCLGGSCYTDVNYFYEGFSIDAERTQGIGSYIVTGMKNGATALCRAINTQLENLATSSGSSSYINEPCSKFMCQQSTTVLLEQVDQGIFHVFQIQQKRPLSINLKPNGCWTNEKSEFQLNDQASFVNVDCTSSIFPIHQIKQYSYRLPHLIFQGFKKAFVNFGFDMSNTFDYYQSNGIYTAPYFYTIGKSSRTIIVDTNNVELRCQTLSMETSLDLLLSPVTMTDVSETRMEQLYLSLKYGSLLFQDLIETSLPNPSTGQYFAIEDKESVTDALISKVNFTQSICPKPEILLMDQKVMNGTLCLEISQISSQNLFLTQDTNLFYDGNIFVNSELNMWPYSNCKDRTSDQYLTSSTQYAHFFKGWIDDPLYLIDRSETSDQINFVYSDGASQSAKTDNTISFILTSISPQNTYGYLQSPLKFTFQVGADSIQIWDQQLLLLNSCQPKDVIIQNSNNQQLPSLTYYYGDSKVIYQLPNITLTNEQLQAYNITRSVNIPVTYVAIDQLTSSKAGSEFKISKNTMTIYAESGENITKTIDLMIFVSEVFYIDQTTKAVTSNVQNLTIKNYLNVIFIQYYREAPRFKSKLKDYVFTYPFVQQSVDLPLIIDQGQAMILQFQSTGDTVCNKLVKLINSKNKEGNYLVITPDNLKKAVKSVVCSFTVLLTNFDSKRVQFNSDNFKITFLVDSDSSKETFDINKKQNKTLLKYSSTINVKVLSISQRGLLTLQFQVPMKQTINPTFTNITTNVTDAIPSYLTIQQQQLDVYTGQIKSMPQPNYTVISFNGINLLIQLKFPNSSLLSTSAVEKVDTLIIILNNTQVLLSKQNEVAEDLMWRLISQMPVQLSDNQQAQTDKAVAETTAVTVKSIMSSSFVINLLMAGSLQKIWSNINVLQLILHIPLLNLILPQNTAQLCGSLITITTFDLLNSEAISNSIFGANSFSQETLVPLSTRLDDLSYTSSNFIYNMGTAFYIVLAVFIFTLLGLILTSCNNSYFKEKVISKITNRFWRTITPSMYLRLFMELNLEILINSYIQLMVIKMIKTWLDYIVVIFASLCGLFCLVFPIVAFFIILKLKQQQNLHKKKSKIRYGELYIPLLRGHNTKLIQLSYNLLWMIRRIILVICQFFIVNNTPSIQIGLLLTMSILWMSYCISQRPFEDPAINKLDILNESFYYLTLLFSFSFTYFNPDYISRFQIGYFFNTLVITMLAINFLFIAKDIVKTIVRKIQRQLKLRSQRKKLAEQIKMNNLYKLKKLELQSLRAQKRESQNKLQQAGIYKNDEQRQQKFKIQKLTKLQSLELIPEEEEKSSNHELSVRESKHQVSQLLIEKETTENGYISVKYAKKLVNRPSMNVDKAFDLQNLNKKEAVVNQIVQNQAMDEFRRDFMEMCEFQVFIDRNRVRNILKQD